MNIKKLFATLAGVSLFAQTVVPFGALAATYSQELQDAYNWAYGKSITTKASIDDANMYGAITRAELAKMLANWAKDRGQTPDTSKSCTFSDTASVQGDLAVAIVESCQLGLMGQLSNGNTSFRPYDTITRAEFGTALSRALWGDKYEGGTPYYARHLDALKAAGIMTQIANAESTKEIRGYVMLMLMRSENVAPAVDCDDPIVVLTCKTDSEECPAACKTTEEPEDVAPKSGDLAVKSSAAEDRRIVLSTTGGAISDLDTLTFKTSEEVTLTKVVLEKYGYADASAVIRKVWLENEDGKIISNTSSVNQKGLVTLTLKKDYKVVDGSLNATIVVETEPYAPTNAGGDIGFKVKDVTSSAANVNLGDYKAYLYDVVYYDGTEATVTARGGEKTYNYSADESYEIAKLKVKAPQDSSIVVRGFTLANSGDITPLNRIDINKYLDKITVKVDGKEVKATVSTDKKGELSISLRNEVELSARQSVEVVILASLSDDFDEYGRAIRFDMASSGLSASDKNGARISVDTSSATFMTYIFNGGKIKLSGTKLGNVDAALNSIDVKIAEGTITIAEAVEGTVAGSVTWTTSGGYDAVDAIDTIRLLIGDDEFEGSINKATNTVTFSNVEIAEGGKVRILVDLKEDPVYEKLTITFGSLNWSLEYSENNLPAEVSGTITVSKLNLTAASGSLKNNLTSKNDAEFRNEDYNTIVVFDGTYTAKKQDVLLKEFTIVGSGLSSLNSKTKVTFFVTVGDAEGEDEYVKGTTTGGAEGDLSEDVLVKVGESVKVKVEAAVDANEPTSATFPIDLGKFDLTLMGEDMNDNPAGEATRKTVNLSIVEIGSVEIETPSTAKTVLRKGAEQSLASVRVKPDGASESIIEEVEVALSGAALEAIDWSLYNADEVFTLYVDGDIVEYSPITLANLTGAGVTITAQGLNTNVKSAGVVVEIELSEELALDVTVNSVKVNNTTSNTKFRKMFVPALVQISNQHDDKLSTKFTFSVDKATSDHVYNLGISTGGAMIEIKGGDEITNGATDEVLNGADSHYITALRYCTVQSCTCDVKADNGVGGCVYIEKADFNDFFKVGDTYARINKSTN